MSFSERYGYKPVRSIVQFESMDGPLRNGLWSLMDFYCWRRHAGNYLHSNNAHQVLCNRLWLHYFKEPIDTLGYWWESILKRLRHHFFECAWYEAYDFIEFLANNYGGHGFKVKFTSACNKLLEREMSAYRFVDGVITPITEQREIEEIEQALGAASTGSATAHLRRSLELLSDRDARDYRNSIKESISAVESFVRSQTKSDKGTLGQLLQKLEDQTGLHPALKSTFSKLYGYTSDEGGIRHALTEGDKTDFNDAKFMLVVCSAFINFVKGKEQQSD